MQTVSVIGAGSFGTALAVLLARQNQAVRLWARNATLAANLQTSRSNSHYLPGISLPANVVVTCDMQAALHGSDWLIFAVPSQVFRDVLQHAQPYLPQRPLVIGAKGIETHTLMTMDEVVMDVLGHDAARLALALSGPSFAREIALGWPTAVVLAAHDEALARRVGDLFFCDSFRAYTSTDVVGVEMGGALKNVMAIAAGGLRGMELGDNTHAALLTRGLAEITRMAVAKGAHPMTLAGLAGMGDLILTCAGEQSRNRKVGFALGRGMGVAEAVQSAMQVAEGVQTTKSAHLLAQRLNIDAPIIRGVHQVLFEGVAAKDALIEIVRRPAGREY